MNINELTLQEQQHFATLVQNAEKNKAEAQQLALDAGKLLSVTRKRLDDYKDRGFFKRCWYKISGKQGSLDRANQNDLIEMQRYAWIYLMKLQEQNLIQAQAIAVIRNNLKDIADEIAEIHDMISAIVEKFDARIEKLEQKTELQDWLLHIDVNESITKDYSHICTLQLTFDYLKVLQENDIDYAAIERRDDLKVALKKFGIDSTEKITVDDFIASLFDEVQKYTYQDFRKILSLQVSGAEINGQYILDNVSGAGYNAIYQFELEMDKMKSMAEELENDDPRKIMLKTVRKAINNPETEYTILELAKEVLCGSLIATEIFKEENNIVSIAPQIPPYGDFSIEGLLGGYISIGFHSFLVTNPSEIEKRCYVESFAILFALIGYGEHQQNYIKSVAEFFGDKFYTDRIESLIKNPKVIDVKSIGSTLNSSARKYAWIVDAMYLSSPGGDIHEKAETIILQMCKVLNFNENEIRNFLDNTKILVAEKKSEKLFQAIEKLNHKSNAWKTILNHRRISLKGAFNDIKNKHDALRRKGQILSLEIGQASIKWIDWYFSIGDENFLQKAAYAVERSSCISRFDELKNEAEAFANSCKDDIYSVNEIIAMFNIASIDYSLNLYSVNADKATSVSNVHWGDNMGDSFDKLTAFVDEITNVLEMQIRQLNLFEEGRYQESIVENDKKEALAKAEQRKQEEEKKKIVTISKGTNTASLHIDFEKISNIPFDYEKIKTVVSDEKAWYVLSDDLWTSEDGSKWEKIEFSNKNAMDELLYVNGTFILFGTYDSQYFYSTDGKNWKFGRFPETSHNHVNIFFAGNKWYLQEWGYLTSYTYVKEGIIWDSEETDKCQGTILYSTSDLSEKWKKFNQKFSTGIYSSARSVSGDEDKLFALCSYDSMYLNNTRIANRHAHFAFALNAKDWYEATCKADILKNYSEISGRFLKTKNGFICASSIGIFHSEDGKKWDLINGEFRIHKPEFITVGNLLLINERYGGKSIYVSVDGKNFQEMLLEHRQDFMAAIKDTILLVDNSKTDGGVFLGKIQLS